MTEATEIDFGWYREPDGRRSRLTWDRRLGGLLYLFRATGESEVLTSNLAEREARDFGDLCMTSAGDAETVRRRAAERWP